MDKCFGSKAVDGAAQPLRRPQAVRMEGMLSSEDVYMDHCRDDSGMMMMMMMMGVLVAIEFCKGAQLCGSMLMLDA